MGRRRRLDDFESEFRRLFDAQFESVARYLDRLLGDPALAADLAQDTFVRLYGRGSVPDDPAAWLFSVANNLLRNAVTKTKRRRELMARANPALEEGVAPRPDEELEAEERRARVRAALDALPLRERQLLLLSAEGYRYREIAGIVGIAEGSVGTLLRRAREKFHAALEDLL